MKFEASEEINDFYNWSRQYYSELSSDPVKGFSGLLNFGCWDQNAHNLYYAQLRLFERYCSYLQPFVTNARGLEIGCGLGGNSIRLCEQFTVHMTAMDISPSQLDIAAQRASMAGCCDQLNFVHGNSMDMPFEDQHFDFSICIESTFHYPNLNAFVSEQSRVLKPGAKAIIVDITCEDSSKVRFRHGNYFYSVAKMEKLLHQNGLELVELHRIGQHVFQPLYDYFCVFSGEEKSKLKKYWSLVFSNYASLYHKGLMGYDIFEIQKR